MNRILISGLLFMEALFFITPAAAAIAADTGAQVMERIVAVVNEDIILLSELNSRMAPYVDRVRQQGLSPDQERRMLYQLREDMIDRMVDETLTDQEVRRQDISVDEGDIDSTIERMKAANSFTDEDLRRFLAQENTTMEEYRTQLKGQLLRFRLVNYQVKSKIVITEEDIRNYYDSHPENYGGMVMYHLRNITIGVPETATGDQRAAVRKKMESIRADFLSGTPFADLARAHSKGPAADQGGDIGAFKRSSLSGQIQDALDGLEPGGITQVLDTDRGFQLFYIEAMGPGDGRPLEAVRQEIQQKLFEERVDTRFAAWLADLRNRSHIKIIN
ncbi:SurA N-terminal domain-containing protein [Desulfosarcina sp. OttesenSCG-928-G10]|nr:SurA N-terminal domain-containing protein [Desulfosarcina sp. OttesenSCG-928-G10]